MARSQTCQDDLWHKLEAQKDSKSLLKKNLDSKVYEQVKNLKTPIGGTIADCMRSGCEHPESGVGIYACDPEGYTVFAPVLDKVIKDYHKITELNHPDMNFGLDDDRLTSGDLDPSGKYIVSTRVRVGRSHEGYGFPPVLNKEDRLAMEKMTVAALSSLTGNVAGKYFPLAGMSKDVETKMIADHFLFKDDDKMLRDAGGYDDWPFGRGIFHNEEKNFLAWVNEEDHMRFISMQMGGNLEEVYRRLVEAVAKLNEKLKFAYKKGLGYLTFCPSNLGTTLRASVHIKIPKMSASPEFKDFCDKHHLQARGIHGEHTESKGGVFDISNKRRLGLSEIEAILEMRDGVLALIEAEKKCA